MPDVLTPDQQAEFDAVPVADRLRPSGDQTPAQARAFAIHDFQVACEFEGMPAPSDAAVEAAIAAALKAAP